MMDYDLSTLPPAIASYLETTNVSTVSQGDDLDLFFHCWIKSDCPKCLSSSNTYPCSWCAVSQTCVPNTVYGYPFGILSPLVTDEICPLTWRERWELRARPFSCRCSSMTFVSVVVAVLATLVGLLLILLGVRLGIWLGRRWKSRTPGWWRLQSWTPTCFKKRKRDASTETDRPGQDSAPGSDNDERQPLLA